MGPSYEDMEEWWRYEAAREIQKAAEMRQRKLSLIQAHIRDVTSAVVMMNSPKRSPWTSRSTTLLGVLMLLAILVVL